MVKTSEISLLTSVLVFIWAHHNAPIAQASLLHDSFSGSYAFAKRFSAPFEAVHNKRSFKHHRKRNSKCAAPASANITSMPIDNNMPFSAANAPPASASSSGVSSNNTTRFASKVKPKSRIAPWDWTDRSNVMYGVNIGSWLMLEKWMTTSLFSEFAPNAPTDRNLVDETLQAQTLGSKTASVLQSNHWNSWLTEADVDLMQQAGVPLGYWAFIPNVQNDPFPALSGQQQQLTRVLRYAAAREMYVILDLHSAPGRASMDQCNGRMNGPVNFYDSDMQQYNDATIHAMYNYTIRSPYKNNIAAIALINEPDACMTNWNQTRITALQSYYQRSYDWMAQQDYRLPLIIHHGFCGLPQWTNFVKDKEPQYLIMEDHPYPGTFVSTSSQSQALSAVCGSAYTYANYPIPVAVTEWTLGFQVPGGGNNFVKQMAQQQIAAWSHSAGSTFWTHRCASCPYGWSFSNMYDAQMIGSPAQNQSIKQWAASMGDPCGNLQTPVWAK